MAILLWLAAFVVLAIVIDLAYHAWLLLRRVWERWVKARLAPPK
jgi:hypothetical protein